MVSNSDTRVCKSCGLEQTIDNFPTYSKNRNWHHNICRACCTKKSKEYYYKNKEVLLEKHREYYRKNRERLLEQKKKHTSDPIIKSRRQKYENKYWSNRKRTDPLYAAKRRCRDRLSIFMRHHGYKKPCKTQEMVGCSWEELWAYLLKTWEKNYGTTWNGEEYNVDHIIPLSSAKTEEEAIKLCHYTNLQMLTPKDNLDKRDKLII